MKRLLCGTLMFLGTAVTSAGEIAATTRATSTLSHMWVQNGAFGFEPFASDPFTCDATTERAMYWNTATKKIMVCDGSAPWVEAGGSSLTSPIAGDFVATGNWSFLTVVGTDSVSAGVKGLAGSLSMVSGSGIEFEGISADAYETTLIANNPTVGDQTYALPDRAGAVSDTIATLGSANVFTGTNTFGSAADAANSVRLGETAGSIVFEGSSADGYETTIGVADPTVGDQTWTTPNYGVAGSWTFASREATETISGVKSFSAGLRVNTNTFLYLGSAGVTAGPFYSSNLTPDSLVFSTGTVGESIHVMQAGDSAYDFQNGPCGTSACTDPTLILHSHNQTTTEWISFQHNAASTIIDSGLGGVQVRSAGLVKSWSGPKIYTLADTSATAVLNITQAADSACSATIQYRASAQSASEIQVQTGQVSIVSYEQPGAATYVCQVEQETENVVVSAGTYAETLSCTNAATTVLLIAFDSSLDVQTTFDYNVTHNSGCVLSAP